jgi:hypothetical protein
MVVPSNIGLIFLHLNIKMSLNGSSPFKDKRMEIARIFADEILIFRQCQFIPKIPCRPKTGRAVQCEHGEEII